MLILYERIRNYHSYFPVELLRWFCLSISEETLVKCSFLKKKKTKKTPFPRFRIKVSKHFPFFFYKFITSILVFTSIHSILEIILSKYMTFCPVLPLLTSVNKMGLIIKQPQIDNNVKYIGSSRSHLESLINRLIFLCKQNGVQTVLETFAITNWYINFCLALFAIFLVYWEIEMINIESLKPRFLF